MSQPTPHISRSVTHRRRISDEAAMIARFAEAYRKKFATLIDHMNQTSDPKTGAAGLRLCVEAVDMMLANQNELAQLIKSVLR